MAPFPAVDATATALDNAVAFYDGLGRPDRTLFAQSVLEALQTARVTPADAEVLYCLLQLVAYCKPLEAFGVLQKLLATGELRRVTAGGDLEALAVRVYAEYIVNRWLVDYLLRRLAERADLAVALAALEVLAITAGPELASAFAALCSVAVCDDDTERVRRGLFVAVRRCGMAFLNRTLAGPERAPVVAAPEEPRRFVLTQLARVIDRLGATDPGYPQLRATVAVYLNERLEAPMRLAFAAPMLTSSDLEQLITTLPRLSGELGGHVGVTYVAETHREMLDGVAGDRGAVTVTQNGQAFTLPSPLGLDAGELSVLSATQEHAIFHELLNQFSADNALPA